MLNEPGPYRPRVFRHDPHPLTMAITSFVAHLQSVSDDEALPLPSLSGTVGTYALGTFVSLMSVFLMTSAAHFRSRPYRLYGVSCLQLYRYGRLYPSDSVYLKVLVSHHLDSGRARFEQL